MDDCNQWGLRRYATLLVVAVFHMALLTMLLMPASRIRTFSAPASHPVELIFISPAKVPKIRVENYRRQPLQADTTISITPPVLDAQSLAQPSRSSRTSGTDGEESGVDWSAEARRALQAFEIRSHAPVRNSSVSGSTADDHWWPRGHHNAGDRYKTADGDWIVWINASCYQVARSAPPESVTGATLSPTTCTDETGTSRSGSGPLPASRKQDPGRDRASVRTGSH